MKAEHPLTPLPRDRWHVGRWTEPAAPPGEPGVIGRVITHHELLFDVVTFARQRGWLGTTHAEASILQEVELVVESSLVGAGVVTDPAVVEVLRDVALRALAWLNDNCPVGYRFELGNDLRLVPINDLDADIVALEAVINAAHDRGIAVAPAGSPEIPPSRAGIDQLARGHVGKGSDGWVVRVMPFVVAGPFGTETEAVSAVERARDELAWALRTAGADDLARTRDRWAPVPVTAA